MLINSLQAISNIQLTEIKVLRTKKVRIIVKDRKKVTAIAYLQTFGQNIKCFFIIRSFFSSSKHS